MGHQFHHQQISSVTGVYAFKPELSDRLRHASMVGFGGPLTRWRHHSGLFATSEWGVPVNQRGRGRLQHRFLPHLRRSA